MIAVADPADVPAVEKALKKAGETVYRIGVVEKSRGEPMAVVAGAEAAWGKR
jgi:phosphoribosylaminoimidazole (AIR) synthetase